MGCATLETKSEAGERIAAIVCGGRAIKACRGCGRLATLLCDFKVVHRGVSRSGQAWVRHGTCSAPICTSCTTKLPGEKDACPEHREACLEVRDPFTGAWHQIWAQDAPSSWRRRAYAEKLARRLALEQRTDVSRQTVDGEEVAF